MSIFNEDYYDKTIPPRPSLDDLMGEQIFDGDYEEPDDYVHSDIEPISPEEEELALAYAPEIVAIASAFRPIHRKLFLAAAIILDEEEAGTIPSDKKEEASPSVQETPSFHEPQQLDLDL